LGFRRNRDLWRLVAQCHVACGATVYEVPCTFTKQHRKHGSVRGKSDPIDANAIGGLIMLFVMVANGFVELGSMLALATKVSIMYE
jgi:transposase